MTIKGGVEMNKTFCVCCGKEIDRQEWQRILERFPEIFDRVDLYGPEALVDHEQTLYNGRLCADCF